MLVVAPQARCVKLSQWISGNPLASCLLRKVADPGQVGDVLGLPPPANQRLAGCHVLPVLAVVGAALYHVEATSYSVRPLSFRASWVPAFTGLAAEVAITKRVVHDEPRHPTLQPTSSFAMELLDNLTGSWTRLC